MNTKTIADLKAGDIFVDTLGFRLCVESVEKLPWLGIPRTKPMARVVFKTESGNRMQQNFRLYKEVEIL